MAMVNLKVKRHGLLAIIAGRGMFELVGPGLRTRPEEVLLHEGCLDLESIGAIKRREECGGTFLWMPTEKGLAMLEEPKKKASK